MPWQTIRNKNELDNTEFFKKTDSHQLDLSNAIFFFDFDNTITGFDVLDDIIKRFSINDEWRALEKAWKDGKIGSKECLEGQLRSVRVHKVTLMKYLSEIRPDPYFKKLVAILKMAGIKLAILSDSFSFIIEYILRNNGVKGVKVYSNRIRFHHDRLIPSFPHTNSQCQLCAHCKRNNSAKAELTGKKIVYIGDGISDICAAQHSHLVFAKDSLLKHFIKKKRDCVAFKDLGDVYNYIRRYLHEPEIEAV